MYGVITGATSGIGFAFAKELAKRGYNLIMIGRREEILQNNAKLIESVYKVKANIIISDLSDCNQVNALIERLEEIDCEDQIDYFINNAGFGLKEDFLKDDFCNQSQMIKLHIEALTMLTHFAANRMIARNRGNIINVSSMAAYMPLPRSPLYSATKGYINILTESLYPQLKLSGVNIQSLCPGFTKTDFHSRLELDIKKLKKNIFIKWMEADKVAELSLKNMKKVIYVPGICNKIIVFVLKRIPKRIYYKFATYLSKEYKKMGK